MRIKYIPQKSAHDTIINVVDENTVNIDGVEHGFDPNSVEYPDIVKESEYSIAEAHRENGELFVVVLQKYSKECPPLADGKYHEVTP